MVPSSSVRVEVKYAFCDFIVIDTRDNFESFHLYNYECIFVIAPWGTLIGIKYITPTFFYQF
jgi:hypothetical protein